MKLIVCFCIVAVEKFRGFREGKSFAFEMKENERMTEILLLKKQPHKTEFSERYHVLFYGYLLSPLQ